MRVTWGANSCFATGSAHGLLWTAHHRGPAPLYGRGNRKCDRLCGRRLTRLRGTDGPMRRARRRHGRRSSPPSSQRRPRVRGKKSRRVSGRRGAASNEGSSRLGSTRMHWRLPFAPSPSPPTLLSSLLVAFHLVQDRFVFVCRSAVRSVWSLGCLVWSVCLLVCPLACLSAGLLACLFCLLVCSVCLPACLSALAAIGH